MVEAAARAISRDGLPGLTLAGVAREAGLAPSTLVQRYGSKRGLLLAVARSGADAVQEAFGAGEEGGVTGARSPLGELRAGVARLVEPLGAPGAMANPLGFLELDLRDEEFWALAVDHADALRACLRALLARAIDAGELPPADTAALARRLHLVLHGALVTWALEPENELAPHVLAELDRELGPPA